MEINRSNIFEIVNKADLKPDKDYGQNYLLEPTICARIIDLLEIKENENAQYQPIDNEIVNEEAKTIDLKEFDFNGKKNNQKIDDKRIEILSNFKYIIFEIVNVIQ